jgi:hypothetical protein
MFKSKLKRTRYGVMAAVIALSLVWLTGASAGSTTFSGEIATSDINIQTGYHTFNCSFETWPDPIYSDRHTFQVSSSGPYTFTLTSSFGGGVGVFRDSYAPANCVGSGQNTVAVSLTAGQTYVLSVFLCADPGCSGPGLGAYSVDMSWSDANNDNDGDGVLNERDNCDNHPNPSQEDGWGSGQGDACDSDWYNRTGVGVAGFAQKSGVMHLHGNCAYLADGAPRCPEIAIFDPLTFTADDMPLEITTDAAGTWSVVVYYLHSNDGDVYQVNTYSSNPPQPDTLVDDRLEIHVQGATWRWHHRGGDERYNGLSGGFLGG